MRILLVRHGHPDYAHDCLTEEGKRQAQAAADRLAREPIVRVFSSSCGRAVETAAPTAERFSLPIERLDFMREIGWGVKDGEEADPRYPYHPWRLAEVLAREGCDLITMPPEDCVAYHGTKAEASMEMITVALDEWLATLGFVREGRLYRVTRKNDDTVALFAHGGSGSCFLSHLLSLPFLYVCQAFRFDYTGITEVRLEGEEGSLTIPVLRALNEYTHIGAQGNNVYGR